MWRQGDQGSLRAFPEWAQAQKSRVIHGETSLFFQAEESEEECETMTLGESVRDDRYDEKIDEEAEEQMLEKYKQERLDEMFPDEVDTPRDIAARIRSVGSCLPAAAS